jgi:hypothetical protein
MKEHAQLDRDWCAVQLIFENLGELTWETGPQPYSTLLLVDASSETAAFLQSMFIYRSLQDMQQIPSDDDHRAQVTSPTVTAYLHLTTPAVPIYPADLCHLRGCEHVHGWCENQGPREVGPR